MNTLNKNCLSYWFPILESSGVRVPKTQIFETDLDLSLLIDRKEPEGFEQFHADLMRAAQVIGTPFFLRSGLTSAKFDWANTCYIEKIEDIMRHMYGIIEYSECASIVGIPYNVWAIREYIPMVAPFKVDSGMPVNKERRIFIEDEKVICSHAYWPHDAIEQLGCSEFDWKRKLTAINTPERDEKEIKKQSVEVSKLFEGAWSLDWSLSLANEWIAIDMAVAETSWHWPGCLAAKKRGWIE